MKSLSLIPSSPVEIISARRSLESSESQLAQYEVIRENREKRVEAATQAIEESGLGASVPRLGDYGPLGFLIIIMFFKWVSDYLTDGEKGR